MRCTPRDSRFLSGLNSVVYRWLDLLQHVAMLVYGSVGRQGLG